MTSLVSGRGASEAVPAEWLTKKDLNVVVMFPYPSGAGLHLGHVYNYAVVDSWCRWKAYIDNTSISQPFGFDAFGLPAENWARASGRDPEEITQESIAKFRQQMNRMGTRFDDRVVTSDRSFYKWTQWLFLKLKAKGLAYKADAPVPWCAGCETVLAREQSRGGVCDRCGTQTETRVLNQWFFKITAYRDRLIKGLEGLDYPESTIRQQRAWLENLHDWCVSRQRKWGTRIPGRGETDTLDTFVDSSFYWLRYLTTSTTEFLPKGAWKPVDLYVGGAEHACMHLVYARFIHYFLYDLGIVPEEEPFRKVVHQGMILNDGIKMSKSAGNTISPDDYNPDDLRMYLMFLGPYTQGGSWTPKGIVGITRFLDKVDRWLSIPPHDDPAVHVDLSKELQILEDTITKYLMVPWKTNRVVSTLMEFYNTWSKGNQGLSEQDRQRFANIIECFAPCGTRTFGAPVMIPSVWIASVIPSVAAPVTCSVQGTPPDNDNDSKGTS